MLDTPRLVLRDFAPGDFAAVHAYATDAEVVRFMEWGPNTPAETEAFLRQAVAAARAEPRRHYELAVVERATGQVIGGIGLRVDGDQAMLGYCLARGAWGRGYATEAARAVVDFGFATLGLHRVWARCDTANAPSLNVLRKVGLRLEGCQRHDCRIRGEWRDTYQLGVLADEWPREAGAR